MAEGSTNTFYLYRLGTQAVKNGATAERGYLVVKGVTYHTIERRDGYVTLPDGTYEIKMELSPTKEYNGSARKQFRIYGHGVTNSAGNVAALLIHLGNYPDQIQGCVAPGKSLLSNGVNNSAAAMEEIFTHCGGFAIGKKADLVVAKWVNPFDDMIRLVKEGVL